MHGTFPPRPGPSEDQADGPAATPPAMSPDPAATGTDAPDTGPRDTSGLYDRAYFQGDHTKSNYSDYVADSLGPSRILGDTLHAIFKPATALDVGCAVGHTINRLRELGVEASGYDISHWAVERAARPYVRQFDFSTTPIEGTHDLVYSYDVVEHVVPDRLEYALKNLWNATARHLVIVPALYPEGTTHDPNELTHLIFHDYDWWAHLMRRCFAADLDEGLTQALAESNHSLTFNYATRIFVFSK